MSIVQGQDWDTVTLRKSPMQRAQMAGNTEKQEKPTASLKTFQKLDHATEAEKLETSAPLELRVRLQQARTAKGLTQAKLAQALNLRAQDIQGFEAGKVKPDNATVQKMSKVLGTKLSGKPSPAKQVVKATAKKVRAA